MHPNMRNFLLIGGFTVLVAMAVLTVMFREIPPESPYSMVNGEPSILETDMGLPPGSVSKVEETCDLFRSDDDYGGWARCQTHIFGWTATPKAYPTPKSFCVTLGRSENEELSSQYVPCMIHITKYISIGGERIP